MDTVMTGNTASPCVAFGPEVSGWGSWEWVGADVERELGAHFETVRFGAAMPDRCDAVVVVKHRLPDRFMDELGSRGASIIYCPVDYYGSAAHIEEDAAMLQRCSRIVVHCQRLRRYFERYAPVTYMDHHIKYATEERMPYRKDGPIAWIGVRTNLPPLVEWVNRHGLPHPLKILANFDGPVPTGREIGLQTSQDVFVERWSRSAHLALLESARGALDVKGGDFRQHHKPPTKAMDYLASGVPLAMNPGTSVEEHLAGMGFEIASALDGDRWFSDTYWRETRDFGGAVRELLSLKRVGIRWKRLIEEVLDERRRVRGWQYSMGTVR